MRDLSLVKDAAEVRLIVIYAEATDVTPTNSFSPVVILPLLPSGAFDVTFITDILICIDNAQKLTATVYYCLGHSEYVTWFHGFK